MGRIVSICVSKTKGTTKQSVDTALFVANHGLADDAHAGDGHRQISILPLERIEEFCCAGAKVEFGDFGENLVIADLEWKNLDVGAVLQINHTLLELTQFGKECTQRCRIYDTMGDCIMPRYGMFAKVLRGGQVNAGDIAIIVNKVRT